MRRLNAACCVGILLALIFTGPAAAQSGKIASLVSTMNLVFDCEAPWNVKNYGVSARFTAALNADKTAYGDLAISGFMLDGNVLFDARLGRSVQPAPGGTSQLHVISSNRLRGIWSLPNNDLILDLTAHGGNACTANVAMRLKPGKKQYSMFGGSRFYYCSSARVVQTTCEAH